MISTTKKSWFQYFWLKIEEELSLIQYYKKDINPNNIKKARVFLEKNP